MIYAVYLFLVGRCRFYVKENITKALNLLRCSSYNIGSLRCDGDTLIFDSPFFEAKKIGILLCGHGISFTVEKSGMPEIISRYKTRWGCILGCALLICTVYASSLFVWKINVIGNVTLSDAQILEGLSELDFKVGTFIPNINVKLLSNEYLLNDRSLSWMSINIIGNCVDVRVKESSASFDSDDRYNPNGLPSVIVASYDGYIERIELGGGVIIKGSGSSVRKGETIISGLMEKEDGSFRLVRSEAKVIAKTSHSFSVSIPFEQTLETLIPLEKPSYRFIFFSNHLRLPFFQVPKDADPSLTQTRTEFFPLPDGNYLPIGLITEQYYQSSTEHITIDEERAQSLARKEISDIIENKYSHCEVLAITGNPKISDTHYTVEITLVCLEDIGQERIIASQFNQ